MKTWMWTAALFSVLALSGLTGCEDEEAAAISEGQACLDALPNDIDQAEADAGVPAGTIWNQAANCANLVASFNSQQANIIKCGAFLTGGGLDTSRIVDAAKELNDAGSNSEAVYIAYLTLNRADNATGLTRSQQAQAACQATEVKGYQFLGNLAATGTALSNALPGGFPTDITNVTEGEIDTAIDECIQNSTDCVTTIANSAGNLADVYCTGNNEDEEICQDLNQAIAEAGGDSTQLAERLLCLLDGQPSDCVAN